MSIFDILKRIKLPSFDNDFIQDEFDKFSDEPPVTPDRREDHAPNQGPDKGAQEDALEEWMRRNNTPGDPQYIPPPSEDDEW